tara:strand:- start:342 stop:836 length:495 start_codon:yes stop_codon:yes gene_type:complete
MSNSKDYPGKSDDSYGKRIEDNKKKVSGDNRTPLPLKDSLSYDPKDFQGDGKNPYDLSNLPAKKNNSNNTGNWRGGNFHDDDEPPASALEILIGDLKEELKISEKKGRFNDRIKLGRETVRVNRDVLRMAQKKYDFRTHITFTNAVSFIPIDKPMPYVYVGGEE